MFQDTKFSLMVAYRSRLFLVAAGGAIVMSIFSWIGFEFSGRQPQTVALDMGLSFLRFFVPLLGILFIQDMVAKEIDRKLIFSTLTYPRSRSAFLLGRFVAAVLFTLFLLCAMTAFLALEIYGLGILYKQTTAVNLGSGLMLVLLFNGLDILVILAFALLLATLSTVSNLVLLVSLGFMVIARSWSGVVRLLTEDDAVMRSIEGYRAGLGKLRYFLPDLGALDIRSVALYGKFDFLPTDGFWLSSSTVAYAVILVTISCMCFERRQFS